MAFASETAVVDLDEASKALDPRAAARRALRAALARYRREPLPVRAFVRLRHWLTPLAEILLEAPPTGRFLDVGCGHGLFAHALAMSSPAREVVGVDPSPAKIEVAWRSGVGLANPTFLCAPVESVAERGFDAIVILDVLYLLPTADKLRLLAACRERITSRGVLLLKTNDTRPRWKFRVTLAQEALMVRAGLTLGGNELHFLGRDENAALLRQAGFEAQPRELPTRLPYPAVLFVATPR